MFKTLRISVLLLVLAAVALGAWRDKTRAVEWKHTLPVNLYLINGDDSPATAEYLNSLKPDTFKAIDAFMQEEALRHGHTALAGIETRLVGMISSRPPAPPVKGNAAEIIMWSLHMRWWTFRHADTVGASPQVKLFLIYFDPAHTTRLAHSTGLQKGLIGRVNVFASADMAAPNNVVIAHEFLHTLGATDKYDYASNQPVFPEGYAAPEQLPLLPQHYAELMAGRTPISPGTAEIPASLDQVVIGEKSAQEINWK